MDRLNILQIKYSFLKLGFLPVNDHYGDCWWIADNRDMGIKIRENERRNIISIEKYFKYKRYMYTAFFPDYLLDKNRTASNSYTPMNFENIGDIIIKMSTLNFGNEIIKANILTEVRRIKISRI